jgi:hypothetical protein
MRAHLGLSRLLVEVEQPLGQADGGRHISAIRAGVHPGWGVAWGGGGEAAAAAAGENMHAEMNVGGNQRDSQDARRSTNV